MTTQVVFENVFADGDAFLLRHVTKAPCVKRFLCTFNDEGRSTFIELIRVDPDPTVLGFLKNKGEGIFESLTGPEPHKLTQPFIYVWLERILIKRPSLRI